MLPINHGFAHVNDVRLHYAETGTGNDLVILLHGFPEFWYSWRHQLEALGKRFHVVAPDMRGYNLSDKPALVKDYKIKVLVNDVIGLIDHFGVTTAAVVGHDWGGGVAWAVAQRHPERVSKVVVMQVPPAAAWRANMSLRQLLRSWYMFLFQVPKLPEWIIRQRDFEAIEKSFTKNVLRKAAFSADDIAQYKQAIQQPGALTAAVNYYRANVIDRLTTGRAEASGQTSGPIRVPALFIFAEQDFAILPETVRGIERFIDAPYVEKRIPDSGHWVQNEAPDEVNDALLEFLGA